MNKLKKSSITEQAPLKFSEDNLEKIIQKSKHIQKKLNELKNNKRRAAY